MIEKYLYQDYEIDFNINTDKIDEAYFFIFNQNRQLYLNQENKIPYSNKEILNQFQVNFTLYFGKYKNKSCIIVNVQDNKKYHQLHEVYEINRDAYQIATRAVLINDWYNLNQYCGKCGNKTVIKEESMALKCPKCQTTFHGKIQPAVIIAIHKGDKLLMAKHTYNTRVEYALIAGFVEMGETIEEAVHREVKEEVGINIKNLKYMGSQPWPFPNSLMCAYKAEYESGEINPDKKEIREVKWFTKEEIQDIGSDLSIYSLLVNDFKNRKMKKNKI